MSDITLAVGDGARRMTYAELAAVRGISALSAERLVRRKHWPRQAGNDGIVRVLVPLTEAHKVGGTARFRAPDNPRTSAPDIREVIREVIRETLTMSAPDVREDIRDRTIAAHEETIRHLRALLADERRRMAEERRQLITMLVDRRPWWRRWFR
jgi:hypothetical protein